LYIDARQDNVEQSWQIFGYFITHLDNILYIYSYLLVPNLDGGCTVHRFSVPVRPFLGIKCVLEAMLELRKEGQKGAHQSKLSGNLLRHTAQ
jgi:hypothetical protein